jgi:dihydropteroate synthase
MNLLNCGGIQVDLSTPRVMGILNVTPDSFSDGGRYVGLDSAIARAETMVQQGASFIDIGGESTRPDAEAVSLDDESRRVIPVIEALKKRELAAVISIDTSKPVLMKRAVEAGAGLINDVNALREPQAEEIVAGLKVPVCLMHMQGEPRTMQANPQYVDVVTDIYQELESRVDSCLRAGIDKTCILIDPGFGFGKTVEQNMRLLKNLSTFTHMGLPLLVGLSRKSMMATILGKEVEHRLAGSIAAATLALQGGASILRVHDVDETQDAIKMFMAMNNVTA